MQPLNHLDKDMHFIAGLMIYLLASLSPINPFLAVIISGAAKEAWDHFSGLGTVDIMDFAWTCIGGLVASAIIAIARHQ